MARRSPDDRQLALFEEGDVLIEQAAGPGPQTSREPGASSPTPVPSEPEDQSSRKAEVLSEREEQASRRVLGALEDHASRDEAPDAADRAYATAPAHNVVLEASAGTGKTTVLVQRYLNLLGAGVDPSHILAMTFTRKAAAEMRQRIVSELRKGAARSEEGRARWLRVRDRVGEIAISTIDAFCLSLLREFPLEADLDPSFQVADETEVARLVEKKIGLPVTMAPALGRHPAGLRELKGFRTSWYAAAAVLRNNKAA